MHIIYNNTTIQHIMPKIKQDNEDDKHNDYSIEYWEKNLGRNISKDENKIIMQAKHENEINECVGNIYTTAQQNNMHIPFLTELDGNCIFECLKYHKICNNISDFRCGLAYLLITLKNKKYFIPTREDSLEEIFDMTNDINIVFCKKDKKIYNYNFHAMCVDLANNGSWRRIQMDLVINCIAILTNIHIHIIHNNGHISKINPVTNNDTLTIYIGMIGEYHYIPICNNTDEHVECPQFKSDRNKFNDWKNTNCLLDKKMQNIDQHCK